MKITKTITAEAACVAIVSADNTDMSEEAFRDFVREILTRVSSLQEEPADENEQGITKVNK